MPKKYQPSDLATTAVLVGSGVAEAVPAPTVPPPALPARAPATTLEESDPAAHAARPVGRPPRKTKDATALGAVKDRIRMTVDFPPTTSERLEWLKEELEASSYIDVLRRALGFYELAVRARKNGGRVLIEEPGKDRKDVTAQAAA